MSSRSTRTDSSLAMPDSTVLVTGARGLMGRALIARAARLWPGASLVSADRLPSPGAPGETCDLGDPEATRALLARISPDVVFHCAGTVDATDLCGFEERLVKPTRVLLEAVAAEVPKAIVVVPGSAAEYGTLPAGRDAFAETDAAVPTSPYGVAKRRQTEIAFAAAAIGLDARVGRIFNLIGPGIPESFLIGRVAAQLAAFRDDAAPPCLTLGRLDTVRDFVDIRDACDALLAIARHGRGGRVYNVCTGVGRSARAAVEAMVRCVGFPVEVREESAGSPRTGLDASIGDPRRIDEECGWRPQIPFEVSACAALGISRAPGIHRT